MLGFSVAHLMGKGYSLMGAPGVTVEKSLYSTDASIKASLSLPYQTDGGCPESDGGNILHEGEPYRIHTQQLVNDTQPIHCEFDQKTHDRFARLTSQIRNEVTAVHAAKKATLLKNVLNEFLSIGCSPIFYLSEWISSRGNVIDQYHLATTSYSGTIPVPPDRIQIASGKNADC